MVDNKPKQKRNKHGNTKLAQKRLNREKAILAESQYKDIHRGVNLKNEDFTSEVTEVDEHEDGSATISLRLEKQDVDMLMDVMLRNAIVNGLKKADVESFEYSEYLAAKSKVIDQTRHVVEMITYWETSDDFDWNPMVAAEVQLLRELLAKL